MARARDMARWAQEEAEGAARHAEDAGAEANHAEDFARMAKADSQHAESEAAKAADLADDAEESYVKAFDEANRAAEEADRAKEEADRAANMGKSPYQVAVEAGYTGTEAEFYAALVALKDAPFLPLSGGLIQGPFAITPKDPDDGTAYDREPWLVICTNNRPEGFLPGYPAGDILWFNHSVVFNDPVEMDRLLVRGTITAENDIYGKAGRFSDTVYAGDGLRVKGKIDVFPSDEYPDKSVEISAEAKVYCRGVIPFSRIDSATDGKFPLGENGNRWNTLYTKKVDASEHIITPRIRPPEGTGTQYLRFITKGGVDPDASPDPLPVEWGGTGESDLYSFANSLSRQFNIPWTTVGSYVGTGNSNFSLGFPCVARFVWLLGYKDPASPTILKSFVTPLIFSYSPRGNFLTPVPELISGADFIWDDDGMNLIFTLGTSTNVINRQGVTYYYMVFGEVTEI